MEVVSDVLPLLVFAEATRYAGNRIRAVCVMTVGRALLLDNNCLIRLVSAEVRQHLRTNLRATGREYWPTAVNVLEALQAHDRNKRTLLLTVISEIAGGHPALAMPIEALRRIAETVATNASSIKWSEPGIARLLRDPESVTDEDVAATRDYFLRQETTFNNLHQELRSRLKEDGGMRRWGSPAAFVDEFWTDTKYLGRYIEIFWDHWKLPGSAPIDELLKHDAWRLYFEGLGAFIYAGSIQQPQHKKVQYSDLVQLIYLGATQDRILATGDLAFRDLGNVILRGRYQLAEIVSLDELIA
jgi:hypothetical protein